MTSWTRFYYHRHHQTPHRPRDPPALLSLSAKKKKITLNQLETKHNTSKMTQFRTSVLMHRRNDKSLAISPKNSCIMDGVAITPLGGRYIKCGALTYNTTQHTTHNTTQHTTQHNTTQHTTQHNTTRKHTRYNTTQKDNVQKKKKTASNNSKQLKHPSFL